MDTFFCKAASCGKPPFSIAEARLVAKILDRVQGNL